MRKVKGLSKKKPHKTLINTGNSVVSTRGKGGGDRWKGYRGKVVTEGDWTWGGEHVMQCR